MIQLESLQIESEWTPVLQDDRGPYRFPSPLPQRKAGPYAGPAVYRWLPFLVTPGDIRQVYVGETDSLARRVNHYLKPGSRQQTNLRMRSRMDALLLEGKHVQLDVLRIECLQINGAVGPADALGDRELRRLVENWMVLVHRRNGFDVLNA